MTTPTPPPWDSPKVETRKSVPNELDMVASVRPGLGPSTDVSGLDEPAAVDRLPTLGIGGLVVSASLARSSASARSFQAWTSSTMSSALQPNSGAMGGDPLRDLRTAVHRLDGDTHPAGQHVSRWSAPSCRTA